ncbi:MAG: hypothetical protein RBS39_08130 [Phycisphaerales bacterium]|jgi:hypothetical protein|nr:hypothetical protein [Phycisphaerales bacterium]
MAFPSLVITILGIATAVVMLVQALTRRVDLLSLRNFFLLGFLIFQVSSALIAFNTRVFGDFRIAEPEHAARIYCVVATVFMILFLAFYQSGIIAKRVALRLPVGTSVPQTSALLTLAVLFLLSGLLGRFVLTYVPVVGPLAFIAGSAFTAAAATIAAWCWSKQWWNPVLALFGGGIIAVAFASSLIGSFGRRDIAAVLLGVIWGSYHGWWKYLPPMTTIFRLGVVGAAGAIFLAAFSTIRSQELREARSLHRVVSALANADVSTGLIDLATGQLAAPNSMWIIDTHPLSFERDPLHQLKYTTLMIVPRQFFPESFPKPDALGRIAVDRGNLKGRPSGFSIGPGLVGHLWYDVVWISLPLYAFLLAIFVRTLDELPRIHGGNAFAIVPVGVALGQIIGLSRGELGLFLFRATLSTILTWIAMLLLARLIARMGWTVNVDAAPDDEHAYDNYADESFPEHEGGHEANAA